MDAATGGPRGNLQDAMDQVCRVLGATLGQLPTVATVRTVANVSAAEVARIDGDGAPDDNVQASLDTDLTGANNDLAYTAVAAGEDGNAVTIAYVDPGENNAVLEVLVSGTDIVVNLATDGDGLITTTADDIVTALEADTGASALVTVANKAANDGTGVVTALEATLLADGADGTGRGVAGKGSQYADYTTPDLYLNIGTKDAPVWDRFKRDGDA